MGRRPRDGRRACSCWAGFAGGPERGYTGAHPGCGFERRPILRPGEPLVFQAACGAWRAWLYGMSVSGFISEHIADCWRWCSAGEAGAAWSSEARPSRRAWPPPGRQAKPAAQRTHNRTRELTGDDESRGRPATCHGAHVGRPTHSRAHGAGRGLRVDRAPAPPEASRADCGGAQRRRAAAVLRRDAKRAWSSRRRAGRRWRAGDSARQ
jgi:hypothetical protein